MNEKDLREKIGQTEERLRMLMGGAVPDLFSGRRWMGRTMRFAMQHPHFRGKLLRFLDVAPSVRDDARLTQLFGEYFGASDELPFLLRQGIDRIAGGRVRVDAAAAAIRTGVKKLFRQFIAAEGPGDAASVLDDLRRRGFAVSLDLLGEEILSERDAAEAQQEHLSALDLMAPVALSWQDDPLLDNDGRGAIPKLDLSVKVSSFSPRIDPVDWDGSIERALHGLMPVARRAESAGVSLTVDMEHYDMKNLTLQCFRLLCEEGDLRFGGIALQAYLPETEEDLRRLIAWARRRGRRVTVRLVKGAYWEYETAVNRQRGWPVPVFLSKEESDSHYGRFSGILLEHLDAVRPAFATHNIRSISHVIALSGAWGIPKESFEFQMLFGMAGPIRDALRQMGYRVRVYAATGGLEAGTGYVMRRLLENTSETSFLRRYFSGDVEEAVLQGTLPSAGPPEESGTHPFRNEPLLDFSREANRSGTAAALAAWRDRFGRLYPLNPAIATGGPSAFIRSLNPANPANVVGIVEAASRESAEIALRESLAAWTPWRETPPRERSECLRRAAEAMRAERFGLIALEVHEAGKSWRDADADVAEAIDYLEYYAGEMLRLGPRHPGNVRGEVNEYFYESLGAGLVISPWNFPLAIPCGMASAALAAGNCVLLKPSSRAPVTAWKLCEILAHAGVPRGVLQCLPGAGGDVGDFLAGHPLVSFIAFTGSAEVGLRILRQAGRIHEGQEHIKRVIVEMGGKNAIIVDETADIDEAVGAVVESAFGYQGQKCSACSRVIVIADVYDRFCERLVDAARSLPAGPPEDPRHLLGPVIDAEALRKIQSSIEAGRKDGRVLLLSDTGRRGNFAGPSIFAGLPRHSPVLREEIFGPVLAVMKAADLDAALEIANDSPYRLTGGIFSRSPAAIERAKQRFRVGNLYINRKITGALVWRQPFGGFGMSGTGAKAGGPDYLLQFLNARSISENTMRKGFAP